MHFSLPVQSILLFAFLARSYASSDEQQCMGLDPMESVATFMGMELDYEMADRICCNNHRYAEPAGYHAWSEVDFYAKLDPNVETVFYDSVCGIPLFVAPRGRSFDEFVAESMLHGWPSFRPDEIISENVIIHDGGRMESKCLTHLGHNLPKGGIDRYCIDLVCMAGVPGVTQVSSSSSSVIGNNDVDSDTGVISAADFDATSYESSALSSSGKYPKTKERLILAAAIIIPVAAILIAIAFTRKHLSKKQDDTQAVLVAEKVSQSRLTNSDKESQ